MLFRSKSGTLLLAGSLQSVPKQRGIVFNADTNTVTNYGSGKSEKILHLQGDVDQDKINELVAGKNYERIVNYAKHNGNFKSETLLDVSGKEIYSAVNVGQNGKGIVAVQYNFRQDYSNDTTISGAKAGEQKVIVEEYNDEKSEYSVSRAMTYSSNKM